MRLHHVGIVVKNLTEYGEAHARLLGLSADSEIIHDPIQKVRAQFWRDSQGALVELIEPDGPESPAWREAQKGRSLNHLCYETLDIEHSVKQFLEYGAMLTSGIVPGIAFGNRRIA